MESAENLSIFVALGGGLLSFLSPCVLPLLPSYLSFITGMSFDDLKGPLLRTHVRKSVVLNSLFFILGFSAVFVALGASFSLVGGFFGRYQGIIQRIAGLIIIFFGLYIAGVFKIPFLMRSKEIIMLKNKPAGYVGAALIGISFGFAWTPCVGPILGAILALAGTSKGIGGGMILLAAYSMGLAVPFFLTSLATGSFLSFFQKFRKILHGVYIAGGILLIIVGILIFTGYFTVLNSLFIELTPSWLWERI
jgi:cytochrome c-type biogenesis protein